MFSALNGFIISIITKICCLFMLYFLFFSVWPIKNFDKLYKVINCPFIDGHAFVHFYKMFYSKEVVAQNNGWN